jgi:diguanylate cyclase (GGDEF)-like protein
VVLLKFPTRRKFRRIYNKQAACCRSLRFRVRFCLGGRAQSAQEDGQSPPLLGGQIVDSVRGTSTAQRLEAFTYLGLVFATAYLVFFVAALPALFLLYAPVMLVTFRVGPLGTKMAVMIVAVTGAFATASGLGPVAMVTTDPVAQAHLFQTFLAVMLLTCLPVAAEISARTRLSRRLKEQAAEAHAEAITDTLTGLLNRRGFERRASALLDHAATPLCCVAIDIDHFKGINDSWGHPFGDHVLRHLAATLRANTRPDDLIGRLGGDEFVMILQVGDHDTGEAICTRIQAALRQQPIAADAATHVLLSISCGIAGITPPDRLRDVIARADDALYQAKAGGRNGFRSAG